MGPFLTPLAPPVPPNLGVASPTPKLAKVMAPKRTEIACRFQLTNYAQCDGLSRGIALDPLTLPLPQIWERSPTKICFPIGSLTERDSVSVPANKFDLLWRTFAWAWCHTRPPSSIPSPKLGDGPPMQNLYCDWLVNGER